MIELGRSRVLNIVVGDRERTSTTTSDRLPQLIFNGLSFGLIIAICSVGLSLIYGTTGLVNFSHGELVTWGAMVAWWINVDHGLPLLPSADPGHPHRRRHRRAPRPPAVEPACAPAA